MVCFNYGNKNKYTMETKTDDLIVISDMILNTKWYQFKKRDKLLKEAKFIADKYNVQYTFKLKKEEL